MYSAKREKGKWYATFRLVKDTNRNEGITSKQSPQLFPKFSELFRIFGLINGKHPRFTLPHKASVNKGVIFFTLIDG